MLLNTDQKLQLKLGGAVASAQPTGLVGYADIREDATDLVPRSSSFALNSTTAVDVLAAPGNQFLRQLKFLSLYNADSAAVTVTVQIDDASTVRVIGKAQLEVGGRLEYTAEGFRVYEASGAPATSQTVDWGEIGGTLSAQTDLSSALALKAPLASPTFTGDHKVSEADFLTGDISPTALAANTNDWAPTGFSTCSVIRASCSAAVTLTGLAGGADGRTVTLFNVGSYDLLLTNEDSGSTAANRFAIRRPLILPPNKAVVLWYDGTSSRWRLMADPDRSVTVVLASDVVNSDAVANTLANCTGLSFDVIAGKTYDFAFTGIFSVAATTTGSRFSVNGPAVTLLGFRAEWVSGTSTSFSNGSGTSGTWDSGPVVNGNTFQTDGNCFYITGRVIPSANGTVILRFASEVSGSAVTVKANASIVRYECLT